MSYTPYTLQTVLSSVSHLLAEAHSTSSSSVATNSSSPSIPSSPPLSSSFFSRRSATSPSSSISAPDVAKSLTPSPSRLNSLLSGHASGASAAAPALPFTIDSVEAWDTNLYVGTSDGCLFHFTLEESADTNSHKQAEHDFKYTARLESKVNLGFGRKSVERILVIPQVSKAVILCDSTLSFYSLPFFDPIPISLIPHIKGVACFSHDVAEENRIGDDGTIELCVVKRRVIQIYKVGELVQLKKEIPSPDGAIVLARHGGNLCLADMQKYKLINLPQASVTPLIPTPQVPSTTSMLGSSMARPVLTVIKEDEFLVVSGTVNNQTTIGIFVDAYGDAIRGTLQWSSYPKSLCVEFPYIAALLRNNTIEIHNIIDQKRLQVIHLDPSFEARGMSLSNGIRVWMDGLARRIGRKPWPEQKENEEDDETQAALRRKVARYSTVPARILIYGRDGVMAQLSTPFVIQADQLLDDNRVEVALEMADQARNTMTTENSFHVERLQNELEYIYQKAGLLLLKETLFDDAFTLLSKGNMDPRVVIQLFGDLSRHEWLTEKPTILLFDGVRALIESVGRIEDIVAGEMEKTYSPPTEEDEKRKSPTMELRKVLIKNAREALLKYLTIERGKRRMMIGQGNMDCKAIDTALLKLYVNNKDETSLYRMLQRPNDCILKDCAPALERAKRFYGLSLLYRSKHMYDEMLGIWTRICTGELPDNDFADGRVQIKRFLLTEADTDHLSLESIMRYSWWLVEQSVIDGVEVFIRSPRAAEMDSSVILDRLEQYGNDAVRTYLEYLVFNRRSQCAEHHTRLACTYVQDVRQEIERDTQNQMQSLVQGYRKSVDPAVTSGNDAEKRTFVGYLGSHQKSSELVRRRLLLLRLLQSSTMYVPENLLQAISEAGPLDIELVIVYGRMKRHEEALNILIHQLSDFVGAETYCVTNGRSTGVVPEVIQENRSVTPARASSLKQSPDPAKKAVAERNIESASSSDKEFEQPDERRQLFSMLLKTYLAIEDSNLMLIRTMHLLLTQGCYLDILEVLELIPEDWPIQMLQDFLVRSLRRSLHAHRNGQVVLSLSRGENVMVSSQLIETYKDIGPVYIDPQSVCQRCHQYLRSSVVVRDHKNGHLLHLQCAKTAGLIT